LKTSPSEKLYFKIGEVSRITGIPTHVLRYWEREFKTIKPVRTYSYQRLYRKSDLEAIMEVKRLLYEEKLTIAGAKKRILNTKRRKGKGKYTLDDLKRDLRDIKALLDSTT